MKQEAPVFYFQETPVQRRKPRTAKVLLSRRYMRTNCSSGLQKPRNASLEFQLDEHLQTMLVIFADKSCIFADNFII